MGYATSQNNQVWERHDNSVGISLSSEGWDSKAMAYPSVFNYKHDTYLLYSGNTLGKEGIGLAKLEKQ